MESFDLDPENHVYLRNRAISALEIHGPNQNWDAFEYDELARSYPSFIGRPVSVDHIGTDQIGIVLDSEFIPIPSLRDDLGLPMMPFEQLFDNLTVLCNRNKDTFGRVLSYATDKKLVRGSDQRKIVEAVARHMACSGWVENVWAIDKEQAEDHTRGLTAAILAGEITDSSMGCFPSGTKILMSDFSEKHIEDIKVGDTVITHTGNTGIVKGLFNKNFNAGIYHLNVTGLCDETFVTHEHPFYAITKDQLSCENAFEDRTKCFPYGAVSSITSQDKNISYEYGYKKKVCSKTDCVEYEKKLFPSFRKISDLREGDYVAYSFSDEVRSTTLTTDFFRLLGYYLAEGCVIYSHGKPNWVSFTFHKKEKEYITEVITLCEHLYGKAPKLLASTSSENAIELHLYSVEACRDLEHHGARLSKTKQVSEEILYAPLDLQLELIGSFVNGDGFLDKSNAVYLETSSRVLWHNLMWMLSRARILWSAQEQFYPIKPHMCGKSLIGTKELTTWKLRLNVNESKKLGSRTAKCSMEWSLDKPKSYNFFYENHIFFPIKELTFDPTWSGNIYNFEVGGDNSYVANTVAVHNCMVESAVCSVCANIATGELPEHQDFCDCIRLHKGRQMQVEGMWVIPFEINRGCGFFEDSLILPFRFGGKAGGEGADKDAKLLEVFSNRKTSAKRAYIETNPNPEQGVRKTPDMYVMIGEMPPQVEENRAEFLQDKKDTISDFIEQQNAPGEIPEGSILLILHEDKETDVVVVEEHEDGSFVVAIDGIDEPVEITREDIIEVKELPEDMDYENRMDSAESREHTERRAAGLIRA